MKCFKKAISVLCAAALVAGLSVPALAYADVPEKHWAYTDIKAVTEKGLMNGAPNGSFQPDNYVTRATIIATLWRLKESPKVTGTAFPDISEKYWAYPAIAWANSAGIATGYTDGTFGPEDTVTREQLAVFLYRYALADSTPIAEGVTDLYPDAEYISPWALTGMKHALGAGLMTGTKVGLSPLGYATRAELATILVRLTTPVKG